MTCHEKWHPWSAMGPVGLHVLIGVDVGASSTLLNCLKQEEVNFCRDHNTKGAVILHIGNMITNITILESIKKIWFYL